jgi:ubiquinone/menaquinone biosynthesis C-methylase UbiE
MTVPALYTADDRGLRRFRPWRPKPLPRGPPSWKDRDVSELERDTRNAYEDAAIAWASGPERVYRHLAAATLDRCPIPLDGTLLLDLGAATGVLGDAAVARGAACIDADVAVDMLRHDGRRARRAVGADGRRLPFRDGCFDVVAANCSLSHVVDPDRMLTDAARVVRRDGALVFSAFPNTSESHPAWAAVEAVLAEFGYQRPQWYAHLKAASEPQVGTADALGQLATAAGLRAVDVDHLRVETDLDAPDALLDWRLGMAQHASFLAGLPTDRFHAIRDRAVERIGGDPDPLGIDLLVLSARV